MGITKENGKNGREKWRGGSRERKAIEKDVKRREKKRKCKRASPGWSLPGSHFTKLESLRPSKKEARPKARQVLSTTEK